MKILVACEESQAVTKELRRLGHEAYSCDIEPCSGGHPEWHLQADALELLKMEWDMILAFPPCTYMTNAGAVRMRVNGEINIDRYRKAMDAKKFFMAFYNADCDKICIENPTPMKLIGLPPYTQSIQPWMFGEKYTKRTCLWLKGLPPMVPDITEKPDGVTPYVNGGCKDANGNYRRFQGRKERDSKTRAKTFPGVARAMAEQWAGPLRSLVQAKKDGRLVVLPCKVGDTVYEANNRGFISTYKLISIRISYCSVLVGWELIDGIYSNLNGFEISALGKTVFLTREEAEAALKKREEAGNETD